MRLHEFVDCTGGATAWPLVARALPRALLLGVCALFFVCSAARPQTAMPPIEPKPVFLPGQYETEARNSSFPDKPVTSQGCIESSGYDAFRDETLAQYQKLKDCRLSDTKAIKNGFAFAIQCKGTKTSLTYAFEKDLVRGTIDTLIEDAPKYSSSVLILMRRVGECPGPEQGKAP
jgi:hypothetical protein